MDTLINTVETFIGKEYPRARKAKTAVTNLLVGGSKPEKIEKNKFAFLNQNSVKHLKDKPINDKQVPDNIP